MIQRHLFEASLYVIPLLFAALATPDRPACVRIGILELLFQIVNGITREDDKTRGSSELDLRSRAAAKYAQWLLWRETLVDQKAAVAVENIELLDDDVIRIACLKKALGEMRA